jgi:hypothetical protein
MRQREDRGEQPQLARHGEPFPAKQQEQGEHRKREIQAAEEPQRFGKRFEQR